jgi:hypothetical protein
LLGKIKETVGDVAETIKRAFAGPKVFTAPQLFLAEPKCSSAAHFTANAIAAQMLGCNGAIAAPLLISAALVEASIQFEARAMSETGEGFSAGAKLVNIELQWPRKTTSAEIQRMNSPATKGIAMDNSGFKTECRALPPFSLDQGKILRCRLLPNAALAYSSAKAAFSRPMSIRSENIEKTPKPLMMRYMLKLVKESGENIRNLEIIGIYRVPKKGVQNVKHDGSTGALKIMVGAEAQISAPSKLILANNKNTRTKVSCMFDEE